MATAPTAAAVFTIDGDHVVPTGLAQGPWDPTVLHGGPTAGLLARAIEQITPAVPMRVGRLTVDLLRPVPMAPMRVEHEIVREGRQIMVVDARLVAEDRLLSRASALLIRVDREIAVDAGPNAAAEGEPMVAPDAPVTGLGFGVEREGYDLPGFLHAVELRRVGGDLGAGVPAQAWVRLVRPLVEGEPTSPLQRVACLGDFTSGLANFMDFDRFLSPNADISYHLSRYPIGEWVGIDSATVLGADGMGQSRARLFDTDGFIGGSSTSLVVAPR